MYVQYPIKILLGVFLSTLLLFSCKSKKYLKQTESVGIIAQDSLWQKINSDFTYKWMDARAKLKIEGQNGFKGKMYLRVQKDSAVLLAIKKLSQEGARILVKEDSLSVINRLDNTFQIMSIEDISNNFGISLTYHQIESLLSGNAPNPENFLKMEKEESDTELKISGIHNDLWYTLRYNKRNGNLLRGKISDRFNTSIYLNYSDYKYVEDKVAIPMLRTYKIYEGDQLSSSIQLEYTDITLNEPKAIKFSIPKNYKRIE